MPDIDAGGTEFGAQEGNKPLGLKRFSLRKDPESGKIDLESLNSDDLWALLAEIKAKLPATTLKSMDLEAELIEQYYQAKVLQNQVREAEDVPANQRVSVTKSVSDLLKSIVKMQADVYNAEQFRKMEIALARALKTLPKDAQDTFYESYGKVVEEMAGAD